MPTKFWLFALNALLVPHLGYSVEDLAFPTKQDSYKDPRSSKKDLFCKGIKREERFQQADLVFFGKFLSRKQEPKKKVFLDRYKIIRIWKGKGDVQSEIVIESPPPSDFCSTYRSNLHEGEKVKTAGGYIIYAKGRPPFLDCCMTEANYRAINHEAELDRLDSLFSKLSNTVSEHRLLAKEMNFYPPVIKKSLQAENFEALTQEQQVAVKAAYSDLLLAHGRRDYRAMLDQVRIIRSHISDYRDLASFELVAKNSLEAQENEKKK